MAKKPEAGCLLAETYDVWRHRQPEVLVRSPSASGSEARLDLINNQHRRVLHLHRKINFARKIQNSQSAHKFLHIACRARKKLADAWRSPPSPWKGSTTTPVTNFPVPLYFWMSCSTCMTHSHTSDSCRETDNHEPRHTCARQCASYLWL